jgi:hypothetical protein
MGRHKNITHDKFPAQSNSLHKRVRVCFHYDAEHQVDGTIVRDDVDEPEQMIIRLDDGRYVLATECMWQPGSLPASCERITKTNGAA